MGSPPTKLNQSSICHCGHALRDHYPGKWTDDHGWVPGSCQVLSCTKVCRVFILRGPPATSPGPERLRMEWCSCEHKYIVHNEDGCQALGCECTTTWGAPKSAPPGSTEIKVERLWRNGVRVVEPMDRCSCGHRWKSHDTDGCRTCRCTSIYRPETDKEVAARVRRDELSVIAKDKLVKAMKTVAEAGGTPRFKPLPVPKGVKVCGGCGHIAHQHYIEGRPPHKGEGIPCTIPGCPCEDLVMNGPFAVEDMGGEGPPLTPMHACAVTPGSVHPAPCTCLPTSAATGATGEGEVLEPCKRCHHPRKEHSHDGAAEGCWHKITLTTPGSWSKCGCPWFSGDLIRFQWDVRSNNPALMATRVVWDSWVHDSPVRWAIEWLEERIISNCADILQSMKERGATNELVEAVETQANIDIKHGTFSGITKRISLCVERVVTDVSPAWHKAIRPELKLPLSVAIVLNPDEFDRFERDFGAESYHDDDDMLRLFDP